MSTFDKGLLLTMLALAFSIVTLCWIAEHTVATTEGLQAYWKFDEGTGNTTQDYTDNDNDAKLYNGPEWIDGRAGKALKFDGSDDLAKAESSDSLNITGSLSISAWVNITELTGTYQVIVAKWYEGSDYQHAYVLEFQPGNTKPRYRLHNVGTCNSASAIDVGKWTFIAGTYDGEALRIYIDGTLTDECDAQGSIPKTTAPLLIGGHDHSGDRNYLKGILDDVRIYDRGLSRCDVLRMYNGSADCCDDGELKDGDDGYNQCLCKDNTWICTEVECYPDECPDQIPSYSLVAAMGCIVIVASLRKSKQR